MENSDKLRRQTFASPLGVITLFLSFTEVVLGYAVIQTSGWVQVALTAFVIIFPSYIFCRFFNFLSSHNHWKLYAPREFPGLSGEVYLQSVIDMMQAVDGLNGSIQSGINSGKSIKEAIANAVTTAGKKRLITITIANLSKQAAIGYWLDFEKKEIYYFRLKSGDTVTQPTFESHKWIIRGERDSEVLTEFTATDDLQHIDIL